MNEKEVNKLFKKSIFKMRTTLNSDVQTYEKFRWMFLEGFQEGLKELQRIMK